ncbi:hypothetical protein DASC09_011780 [Saccharomycopsis crataegensis]|uniref:Uncharacterized protein n=1 Tax=Saccharomycopsis crataegensis TaxID=43959 RepID=A0AAV5QI74_9ASCO|nr:hypothetical protein DASC09_011780 [Saccharomycopsis crataegensis]
MLPEKVDHVASPGYDVRFRNLPIVVEIFADIEGWSAVKQTRCEMERKKKKKKNNNNNNNCQQVLVEEVFYSSFDTVGTHHMVTSVTVETVRKLLSRPMDSAASATVPSDDLVGVGVPGVGGLWERQSGMVVIAHGERRRISAI